MNIKKSTVVRTIMFAIVLVNWVLKYFGKSPIAVDESVVYQCIECVVSIIILVLSFWKNNSFTKNAQKADEYLEKLKDFNESEE